MEAGCQPQIGLRAVRGQWNVVRLGECCDLFHLGDSAGIAAVGLNNVDGVFREVGKYAPNSAIAFAARQWDFHLLLNPLERLDVTGNGRLFEKQEVVRRYGGSELNHRSRW